MSRSLRVSILSGDMKLQDGWVFTTKTGNYGTNYIPRALVTAIGLGANRPPGRRLSQLGGTYDPNTV